MSQTPRTTLLITFVLVSLLPDNANAEQTSETSYDLVIYGGTSAGVVAAVQAKRMGKSVILVAPSKHLGGLSTAGLGFTDAGDKRVVGGLSREFYRRIKRKYDDRSAWTFERPSDYLRYQPDADAMWTFEPHVAERVFEEMLAEAQVPVLREQRLDRQSGVKRKANRIDSVQTRQGLTLVGKMFIDATYEGDLLAAAQVSYTVGRESNAKYGETLNGVQKNLNTHNHRFLQPVDPYVSPGKPESGLLPGIHAGQPGEDGQSDQRVQAYCFRMCMTNIESNRVPFAKPDDYDPLRFELLLRNFEAGDHRIPYHSLMMPNGKTDTNNNGAFSTDNIGMNDSYPEASYEERAAIVKEHLRYQQGLMWTLANHPRVPATVRNEVSKWGLSKDEFVDSNYWPHMLYIRESRRMVSDYVATEHDCRRTRVAEDPVGMGSYNMDSHNTQRYVSAAGFAQNEGDVQVSPGGTT